MNYQDFLQLDGDPSTILQAYSGLCTNLLTTDPDTIRSVSKKMRLNLIDWAKLNCGVYKDYDESKIYSRADLLQKQDWYVSSLEDDSYKCHTSGSTTGDPFNYLVWKKYHNLIEDNNEYGMILDEFGIPKNDIKILVLMKIAANPIPPKGSFSMTNYGHTSHALHGHKTNTCHSIFLDFSYYQENVEKWHDDLIEFFQQHTDIDVIMSNGPIINIMLNFFRKRNFTQKLCKLLSHTTEFPRYEDFQYLKDNGYIDSYCDNMRCWDGGATFFSCKYETYHLMDNLSWTECVDNKLISTDYFSFPSPFIRYWNGDLCEIKDEYQLCACGRWYRPFKMLQNRPFALKGPTKLTQIKEQIAKLSFKHNINQVQFDGLIVNVYLNKNIGQEGVNKIKEILKDYKVTFYE
jgi:DNA-directed RNA polymerase subunit N (RpoN/RPB10)